MSGLKKEYQVETCFKDRRTLEESIKGHHQQKDGTYLLVGTVKYKAVYNSKKDMVILTIYGKNAEDLAQSEMEFFRHIHSLYK